MGEVYRARDTRLDRSVAIKVLPPALAADAELRERFEREARAISSLRHPHICALYDVGVASIAAFDTNDGSTAISGGRQDPFPVLELLEAETLEPRLRRSGPLPVSDGIKIALQVCDALDKAHVAGIVHRDLKPGNVFLERAGSAAWSAKLLDFGLADTAVAPHHGRFPCRPVFRTSRRRATSSLPNKPWQARVTGTTRLSGWPPRIHRLTKLHCCLNRGSIRVIDLRGSAGYGTPCKNSACTDACSSTTMTTAGRRMQST